MAPRADLLDPLAAEWLAELPVPLANEPDIRAVIHCTMREEALKRTKLADVRAQFNPLTATELGLPWWERLLRMTVAPVGMSVVDRRNAVVSALQRLKARPRGVDQVAAITRLIGAGWEYYEHNPADALSPPAGVVRIVLPTAPSGDLYARYERAVRGVIEAHLDIATLFTGGFVLDFDMLDDGLWG